MKNEKDTDLLEQQLRDPAVRLAFEQEWLGEEFVTQLEEHMSRLGVTRKELADRLGKTPAAITQALRHGRNLTMHLMVELAAAVNLRVGVTLIEFASMPWPRRITWTPASLPTIEWVVLTEKTRASRTSAKTKKMAMTFALDSKKTDLRCDYEDRSGPTGGRERGDPWTKSGEVTLLH